MDLAIIEAEKAALRGEVPIGAVVVDSRNGEILARAGNQTEEENDPTAHAEIVALRLAAHHLGSPRLPYCDLYVTLEPCTMCATAISFARIRRLYFGAYDPKGGGVDHGAQFYNQPTCHHRPDVYGGLRENECALLLRSFFQEKRA
ncbi:nucleoside deaminase [Terasakiella sp.]|uniref:nucleoside deaminase n=1 Tax=Terasakiella sp. TaxID=2034861 RepID=UPI003AA7F76D